MQLRSGRRLASMAWLLPAILACDPAPASLTAALASQPALLAPVSRRARGIFAMWDDSCGFTISRLEVEPAAQDGLEGDLLTWRAAAAGSVSVLRHSGVAITSQPPLNVSAGAGAFGISVNVSLAADVNWTSVGTLALWDPIADAPVATLTLQKLQPGAEQVLAPQPAYFDSCLQLSSRLRLRWSLTPSSVSPPSIDLGLEGVIAADAWIGFGPVADPNATDRLMGGADVILAGLGAGGPFGSPFAVDAHLSTYTECMSTPSGGVEGVCDDVAWSGGDASANQARLVLAERSDGTSLLRVRRPLDSSGQFDKPIVPHRRAAFIWAVGAVEAPARDGWPAASIFRYHGPVRGESYGELKGMPLGSNVYECRPFPQRASSLGGNGSSHVASGPGLLGLSGLDGALGPVRIAGGSGRVDIWWRVLADDPSGAVRVRFGVRCAVAGAQWCSLMTGRSMAGGYAWVARSASVGAYTMGSTAASSIIPAAEGVQAPQVVQSAGSLSFAFTAPVVGTGLAVDGASVPFMWAAATAPWAETSSPGSVAQAAYHGTSLRSGSPTNIDLASGAVSVSGAPMLLLLHAAGMLLAWALLLPLGAIVARQLRASGSKAWFRVHSRLAYAASVLSLAAAAVAYAYLDQRRDSHFRSDHGKLGLATFIVLLVQVVAAVFRPAAPAPRQQAKQQPAQQPRGLSARRIWSQSHRLLGVSALALGCASLLSGVDEMQLHGEPPTYRYAASLAVWLGVCALASLGLELSMGGGAAPIPLRTLLCRRRHFLGLASAPPTAVAKPAVAEPAAIEMRGSADDEASTAAAAARKRAHSAARPAAALVALGALAGLGLLGWAFAARLAPTVPSPPPEPPNAPPTLPPPNYFDSLPAHVNVSAGCAAFPTRYVGDGWCDAHEPYNTAACGWDGGDCCSPTSAIIDCRDPLSSRFGQATPKGAYPAPVNPRYTVFAGRSMSLQSIVESYNNAYEFTGSKNVAPYALPHAGFFSGPWHVRVSGSVASPLTLDVDDLIRRFALESRTYAHRCVEAWSIIVPWVGFPLAKLLDVVQPTADTAFVTFTSYNCRTTGVGACMPNYDWPYREAITIEEARNELAFLSVGAYQGPLPPQSGGPLRLTLPWKYGFKSIKYITDIQFVAGGSWARPYTFWSNVNPMEYGFWANVNPEVRHPRWSQARERTIVSQSFGDPYVPTQLYNGYAEQVEHLYADLLATEGNRLFM